MALWSSSASSVPSCPITSTSREWSDSLRGTTLVCWICNQLSVGFGGTGGGRAIRSSQ